MTDELQEVKPTMIKVEVLSVRGETVLVRYRQDKKAKQVIIPTDAIDLRSNKVKEEDLEAGLPYGIPWAELIELKASSEDLEKLLHQKGIWTLEDLTAKSKLLPGIMQELYGVDMATLFRTAKQYKE